MCWQWILLFWSTKSWIWWKVCCLPHPDILDSEKLRGNVPNDWRYGRWLCGYFSFLSYRFADQRICDPSATNEWHRISWCWWTRCLLEGQVMFWITGIRVIRGLIHHRTLDTLSNVWPLDVLWSRLYFRLSQKWSPASVSSLIAFMNIYIMRYK